MAAQEISSQKLKVIEKIPFFSGLSLRQVKELLHSGRMEMAEAGKVLCREGDKSTEMYVLLAGELAVKDGEVELARVKPVEIVGEMGMVSNQPRCATVEAADDATVMVIGKMQFEALMRKDVDMASRIYRNMLDAVCQKIRENNIRLLDMRAQGAGTVDASAI